MKRAIAGILILFNTVVGWTQAVQSDFSIPPQACLNQNVELVNLSSNAIRYEWDFCQGDLALMPSASLAANLAGNITTGVEVVFDGIEWFGFIANQNGNAILKLSFGNDITSTPVITNLGNISGVINSPTDIKVVIENDNWYGFVYGLNSPMISRIDFGNSLHNTPVAEGIVSGSGSTNGGFDMIREGNHWMMVLSYFNMARVVRLTSITATPDVSDMTDVGAFGSSMGDIALVKSDESYFAYAVDFGNRTLYRLAFGASVFNPPVVTDLNVGTLSSVTPFGIDVGQDNLNYYAMISTIEGSLIRVDLGQNLSTDSPTGSSLGNMGVLENSLKIKLLKQQSRWFAFAASWSSTNLYRVSFSEPTCETPVNFSTAVQPIVKYNSPGVKAITLRAFAANGAYAENTQPLLITGNEAPELTIHAVNHCIASPTNFEVSSTLPMISYNWNFGDAVTAVDPSPAHQYTTVGVYTVTLQATATNGCENLAQQEVQIFNQPVTNFTLPVAGVTCTNHNYSFTNTTIADEGSAVTWQWQVDNVHQSNEENASLAFLTTGNHEVKLTASIPGCFSEATQTFSVAAIGPEVSYTHSGFCQNSLITFVNETTGPVTNYAWDFGDGQTSDQTHAENMYTEPGSFTVTLAASNAAGCSNSLSKSVTVYSSPEVDFTALAPPFSCSGTPTQFNDLTPPPGDSNLSSWLWNFGDAGSPSNTSAQRNPQHTYATAEVYTVSLTVTTNFSCSATLQKPVTIHQTPTAAFTHTALCEDSEVTFSDAASTNQAWNWQIGPNFYFTESPVHVFNNPGNYHVVLSVTGMNNCIGSTTETVVVPQKLNVDFSSFKNCVKQETVFTDLTNDSSDPVTGVNWSFGSLGTAETNPAIFKFIETGEVQVTLTVTSESGCVYTRIKPIHITEGPLASFTANPNTGEAPLSVQFINTSLQANTFSWRFNTTGSSSTLPSPTFVYGEEGNYIAELVVTDLSGCRDTTQQLIEVRPPAKLNPPSPNPSSGIFTIEWKSPAETQTAIVLVDAVGREIRNFEVPALAGFNRYILDISDEQPGLYILRIRYMNTVKTYRLMVSE